MSFLEQLKSGKRGELIAWDLLSREKWVAQVIDVRDDKRFQSVDIDYLIHTNDRKIFYMEVKTDEMADKTGNIAYEISTSGNIGCFLKTKADYVFYYLPNGDRAYVIDVKKINDYVDSYPHKEVKMGDNAKGFLLPINELVEKGVIIKRYDI